MDPNATYELMTDESADIDDRVEAAHSLRDWLARGGYQPRVGITFGGNTAARFYIERRIDVVLRLVGVKTEPGDDEITISDRPLQHIEVEQ